MNMLADRRTRVAIEVVHDLVCPWCFLGARRLRRAISRRSELAVTITWRPFFLNPDMPRAGMASAEYAMRKWGSEERARRMQGTVAVLGAAEGIPFRFDRIARTPSSVDAHRLVLLAAARSPTLAHDVVDALFVAHFAKGRDIGDHDVLAAIAVAHGLDPVRTRRSLAGAEGTDVVHGQNLRSHRLGITGVPSFTFGERTAIAGAQDVEVIERLLDVAAIEAEMFA